MWGKRRNVARAWDKLVFISAGPKSGTRLPVLDHIPCSPFEEQGNRAVKIDQLPGHTYSFGPWRASAALTMWSVPTGLLYFAHTHTHTHNDTRYLKSDRRLQHLAVFPHLSLPPSPLLSLIRLTGGHY